MFKKKSTKKEIGRITFGSQTHPWFEVYKEHNIDLTLKGKKNIVVWLILFSVRMWSLKDATETLRSWGKHLVEINPPTLHTRLGKWSLGTFIHESNAWAKIQHEKILSYIKKDEPLKEEQHDDKHAKRNIGFTKQLVGLTVAQMAADRTKTISIHQMLLNRKFQKVDHNSNPEQC